MDAPTNARGTAAIARLDGAMEALGALSARALADNGASRTRPRRTLGRCKRLAEGGLLADEEEEQGTARRAHAGDACQTKCYSRHASIALRPRGASGALLPRLTTPP